MIYITEDDLKAESFERYITESTGDFTEAKDKAELTAIGIAKTYLSGRYDVATIFNIDAPVRNELLVQIIVDITLAKVFGRNKARKLPTDIKEDEEAAIETLEKLNAGKLKIELPAKVDENTGTTKSTSMWGNNSNNNYFI